MARVYILNKGGHDYTDAARFGELVVCTDGPLDKSDISQMFREMSEALEDSTPEDFIVLTSLASLCSIASAIFAAKHGRLNLLIYRADGYISRTVVVNNGTRSKNVPRILRGSPHQEE